MYQSLDGNFEAQSTARSSDHLDAARQELILLQGQARAENLLAQSHTDVTALGFPTLVINAGESQAECPSADFRLNAFQRTMESLYRRLAGDPADAVARSFEDQGQGNFRYEVQRGDDLPGIARSFARQIQGRELNEQEEQCAIEQIYRLNSLRSGLFGNNFTIGRPLIIPRNLGMQ